MKLYEYAAYDALGLKALLDAGEVTAQELHDLAVQAAEPRKFGFRKPWNGMEDARLFAMLELGLEADHVEQGAQVVVLPQLHHGIGLGLRRPRVGREAIDKLAEDV